MYVQIGSMLHKCAETKSWSFLIYKFTKVYKSLNFNRLCIVN